MKSETIRNTFLSFFSKHGHQLLPPASVISTEDPTVLFTTAGMQPLKPYFLGSRDSMQDLGGRRLATIQPCFRTSDIESIGDANHLTFFEMLGNFSLGDYDNSLAIELAWKFLTHEMRLPVDRLWATYFTGDSTRTSDKESAHYWKKYLPMERIIGFGADSNWWGPPGPSGPCGPSTEIHFDLQGAPCRKGSRCKPNCDCERFVEIWNVVIMTYHQSTSGKLTALPSKNIDTGMGLERLSMISQAAATVFETDLFEPLMTVKKDEAFGSEGEPSDSIRARIVADHIRGVTFLISQGVFFSNKDQGYVLRRIFRRAVDQFHSPQASLAPYIKLVIEQYGKRHPELIENRQAVLQAVEREHVAYSKILRLGVKEIVEKFLRKKFVPSLKTLPGPSQLNLNPEEAFQLYSSYGLSPDRLKREGFAFNLEAFERKVAEHQALSRKHSKSKFGGHGLTAAGSQEYSPDDLQRMKQLHTATHLLHAALRQILGFHVRQQGSEISPERLRFDFEHPLKLSEQEKRAVESLVNEQIKADLPVTSEEKTYEEAIRDGALAFFKERYPKNVTVYSIGKFSKELCGGPHVKRTSELGTFQIISERSAGAGIRRIKAVLEAANPAKP